ncbi:MAG: YfhO family protein [bacterium]
MQYKGKSGVTENTGLKKKLILCLLLGVCILYFHDILKGGFLFTERDLSIFFIPPRKLWTDMIKVGTIPLWNPFFSCGQPLFAALQPGILYPPNLLFLLFPFDYAFNLIIILHFFLAGFFTYLFLKTLQASDTAALTGGIIFMLSGYLLSVQNLLIHLLSVIWIPLVLLNYHQYLRKRQTRYLIYTAAFLVMMFLGGAVEILYGTFMLLFILMCFPDPFGVGITPPPLKKRGSGLLLIILLFILLAAVQLLPFFEMAFHSIRAEGLVYKEAVTWSLDSKDLIQFFLPDLYGYTHTTQKYWHNQSWLKTIYLGIIPFVLFAFFLTDKKRKALPLILIMEISLLLAFGGNTPVYRFLFLYVPFFNTIRYPVKFLFIFIFFISIVAGMGYDSLCKQIADRSKTTQRMIHGILAGSVFTVCVWSLLSFYQGPVQAYMNARGIAPPGYNFPLINVHNIKRFLLFCSILGPIMVFGWRYVQKKRIFSIALMTLLILDLFFANRGFYQKYPAERYHEPSETVRIIKKDPSLFRVATTPKTQKAKTTYSKTFSDSIKVDKEKITPGFNLLDHIYNIQGAEVIRLGHYEKIYSLITSSPKPDSTNLFPLLNVKYLISKYELDTKELELVEVVGDKEDPNASLLIYKNLKCLPRAFLIENYQILRSEEEYKEMLQSKGFDPATLVLLDKDPFLGESHAESHEPLEVKQVSQYKGDEKEGIETKKLSLSEKDKEEGVVITDYQPNRIEISASLQRPKILFLSDTHYPGWKVYVDGEKGEIFRADFAFRAVPLPPGEHRVVFVYRPLSVILGGFITLLTIGFILFLGFKGHSPDRFFGTKKTI